MTAIDWALVLVLGLSILLGVVRGVVRELFALAGWITGVVLALRFSEPLAAALPFELPLAARTALVGLFIIVGTLLLAALLAVMLRATLKAAKLSLEDRLLGGMFGVVRGALLIGIVAMLAMAAGAPRQPWWEASTFLPWVQASVRFASPLLPQSLARHTPNPG